MNYALIGCGRISPNHIAAAIENNLNIVALCDITINKIEEKLKNFNLSKDIRKYTSYKEMFEKENIDLAAIATESGNHAEIALYCIEKGINVIVEKPIALSLEDADAIIKASKERDVKICACHQNRFNKSVQKIREAIEKKTIWKTFLWYCPYSLE